MKNILCIPLIYFVSSLLSMSIHAQVWIHSTNSNSLIGNWQSAESWTMPQTIPGSTTNASSVLIVPTSPLIITNATPQFPITSLTVGSTEASHSTTQASLTLLGNGTLTISGDVTLHAPLILGNGFSLTVQGLVRGTASIILATNATLRLTSTSETALASTASISALHVVPQTLTTSAGTVVLGARYNNGVLWGNVFGDAGKPFQGNLRIESTMTLRTPLVIGDEGAFDFTAASSNKLILATSATIHGNIRNQSITRFFVTAPAPLFIGNVSISTFFVGITTSTCNPLTVVNNGTPAIFGVRARTVQQITPLATGSTVHRMPTVNCQWNVTQVNNVVAGTAVSIKPSWVAGQENVGFNRSIAVSTVFPQVPVSSAPFASQTDAVFPSYFQHSVTMVQTASNLLKDIPVLVTSQPRPEIIIHTPTNQSSGNTVRIIGRRFISTASVRLGQTFVPQANIRLSSGNLLNPDTLIVVVPFNVVGFGNCGEISVIQPGGTSTFGRFGSCYPLILPDIFSVSPTPVPSRQGDQRIIISGRNFGLNTPRVVAQGNGLTLTLTPIEHSSTRTTVIIPAEMVRHPGTLVLTVTSVERAASVTNVTISLLSSASNTVNVASDELSSLAPNPASNLLLYQFTSNNHSLAVFQILDLFGRIVRQEQRETPSFARQEATFDVSNLANGVYVFRMIQGTEYRTHKFVVSR